MEHRFALLLLVASLFVAGQSASLHSTESYGPLSSENVCAQTCNLINGQVAFRPGQTYVYKVDFLVAADGATEDSELAREGRLKVAALADISVYGQCELVLKLRKVHIAGIKNGGQLAAQLEAAPMHFAYEDGKVVEICAESNESKKIVDIKKAIVSALQMSSSDVSQKQTIIETDISGQCETEYEALQHDSEVTIIRKTKNLGKCGRRHQLQTSFFPQAYGLDHTLRSSLPYITTNQTQECTQVLKNQIIELSTCEERQPLSWLQVQIYSRIQLQLVETIPRLTVPRISGSTSFRSHRLTMSPEQVTFSLKHDEDDRRRVYTLADVQHLLRQICGKIATSVERDVPVLFHELTVSLYSISVAEQAQLWEQIRSRQFCPSGKLEDLFLDASALAGNEGSVQVLITAYQQHQITRNRANYLFGLLAFSKVPTVEAAQRLVAFVQSQNTQQLLHVPRGVLFGITGFVHNLQIVQQQSSFSFETSSPQQVDQIVQNLVQTLLQTIRQVVPQISNHVQQQEALTLVYALKNLILVHVHVDQIPISQHIFTLLQHTPAGQQHTIELRVAFVRTLATAGITDEIRQYLIESILQNTREGIEIQIEAYRAVVLSGASQQQLETIKAYTDRVARSGPQSRQLVNYIRSHQANLRSTSDPHKRTILPINAPVFEAPSRQWFGISRNYELSYVNQAVNFGVTAESDVIYEVPTRGQFAPVPQTIAFNLTIPIGGQELQLVEVRLHQHGLEPVITQVMGGMSAEEQINDPWKVAQKTVTYLLANGADILEQNPHVHVLIQIIIDGKTVVLVDEQDLISEDVDKNQYIRWLMEEMKGRVANDDAFAFTPIDSVLQFPSVSGLPVHVRVNSTVVFGLKTNLIADIQNSANSAVQLTIYPSFAGQLETAVEFQAGDEGRKSVEYISNIYSAPQVDLVAQVAQGRVVNFKINMPHERYTLLRVESAVYSRNEAGERVRLGGRALQGGAGSGYNSAYPNVHVCTQSTHNVLGVVFCYDFSYNTIHGHGVDLIAEVTVVKTDHALQSYDLSLHWPISASDMQQLASGEKPLSAMEIHPFKVIFNTPGSEIDRQMIFELELPTAGSSSGSNAARLRVQTPWKQAHAELTLQSQPKELLARAQLTIDERQYLVLEAALESIRRGQKTEFRPRLIINADQLLESPVHLAGILTTSRGRKSAIHFQLEDVQGKSQLIKGTYIRERAESKTGVSRTSADVAINLIGLNAKAAATFELGDRLVKFDLSSDYQARSWSGKEQAKIAFKIQNLSSGKMLKLVNFGVVKMSQWPKYQIRYSQNLMYAANEQFEHDLKLGWSGEEVEQLRLYQSLKKTGQRGKIDLEGETLVVYRPEAVNYQIRTTAALVGLGSAGVKRYNIVFSGQPLDAGADATSAFNGEFVYSTLNKSPLQMKMRASLKSAAIDFVYADEIEEKSPSEYHGHLLVQLTPAQKYDVAYIYSIKNDLQSVQEHEMNVELKSASSQKSYRHHGLLRLESGNRNVLIRSKLTGDGQEGGIIYDGELQLAPGRTQFYFDHNQKNLRAKAGYDLTGSPMTAMWEFTSPEMKHESNWERIPEVNSWSFNSKTKKSGENVLEIEATDKPQLHHKRLRIASPLFNSEAQLDLPIDEEQKVIFNVDHHPSGWSHQTSAARRHPRYITLDSKTKNFGDNMVDLSAKYAPNEDNYFKLSMPNSGVLSCAELIAEMHQAAAQPYASLDLNAPKWSHKTKMSGQREGGWISLNSKTDREGENFAAIDAEANWSDLKKKSFAKVQLGQNVKSTLEMVPYKSAKVIVDHPEYDHLTEWNYQPEEQAWKIQSSTVSLKGTPQRYQVNAEHQRGRRSAIKIDVPAFDSDLSYSRELDQQMAFQYADKAASSTRSPFTHKTVARWSTEKHGRPILRMESQTSRGYAGQEGENVFQMNAAYHHAEPSIPSTLSLKLGKSMTGDLEASIFNPNMKSLRFNAQSPSYRHQSEVSYQPTEGHRFNLDSTTDRNGQPMVSLKTVCSANAAEKCALSFRASPKSAQAPYQIQAELERQKRSGVLDFDFVPYEHRTEFNAEGDNYRLKTSTSKSGRGVFDLDGLWASASEQSHLKMKTASPVSGQIYQSQLLVHPLNRFGQFNLDSANLKHQSSFKLDSDAQSPWAHIKSNTIYSGEVLADVDAQLRGLRGQNKIDATLPGAFSMKSVVDVPQQIGSFDLTHHRSGRHLLGSVAVNSEVDADRSFHVDLAWDVDRNPASKVQADFSMKRLPSRALAVVASIQYATNKMVFNSEALPEAPMSAPIRISLGFVPLDASRINEAWQLVYVHSVKDYNQFQCNLDFLVGQQQLKYGVQLTSQLISGEKIELAAKTIAPQHPQLEATFSLVAGTRAPGQEYFADVSAVYAGNQQYQIIVELLKHLQTRKIEGKVELRAPQLEVHIASFTFDLVQKRFALDLINEKTGKQVDIEANYSGSLLHLKALSNVPLAPKIDATVQYIPGEELHAKLDLDEQRKFEITAKYTGELSKLQFYVLTKVDSVYTPSVEFIAEGQKTAEDGNAQRSVSISGKYNMVEILSGVFRQEDVQQWEAEGAVSSIGSGEKIFESRITSLPQKTGQLVYWFKLIPKENAYVRPVIARVEERRPTSANGHLRSIKIELMSEAEGSTFARTEVSIQHAHWSEIPSMIEATLVHLPTSSHGSLRLALHEPVQEQQQAEVSLFETVEQTAGISQRGASKRYRDQIVVGWNQKSVGFALVTATYGSNAVEHEVKIYSPLGAGASGRVFQIRCAHQITANRFFAKQLLRVDATQQNSAPLVQYTILAENSGRDSGYIAKVQLESYKFTRSPKMVELQAAPATEAKPVDIKLRLDVGQSEQDAIILKTVLQRKANNEVSAGAGFFASGAAASGLNNTVHFSAKTADRTTLNFEFDGHVSQSSIGMLWKNLNRRGQQQQGHYQLRFIGADRLEAVFANPSSKYIISGIYKRKAASVSGRPLVMDFVVSKYVAKVSSWSSKTAELVPISEHKVHVEAAGQCIRADIEKSGEIAEAGNAPTTRQVNLCADLQRSNIVHLSVDAIKSGQKTVDLSARIDSRSAGKALQVSAHWNPIYSRQLLATLLQLNIANSDQLTEAISQHELFQELAHKYTVIGQKLATDAAYEPISKILVEEMAPIAEEFGINSQAVGRYLQAVIEPIRSALSSVQESIQQYTNKWSAATDDYIQAISRSCARSSTCSKVSSGLWSLTNTEELAQLAAQPVVSLLQKTHRFVVRSQGKLVERMPEINFDQFVPEAIQRYITNTVDTLYTWARQAAFDPQSPFAGIIGHLETIISELFSSASFNAINWERIEEAIQSSMKLFFAPSAWTSSVRALIWDPQNGQLQMEIKTPSMAAAVQQQLYNNESDSTTSGASSSWYKGINSYDRYTNRRYFH